MLLLVRQLRLATVFALATTVSACATYSQGRGELDAEVSAGRYDAALKRLAEQNVPERDRVLNLLDRAMLQRLAGDYGGSNATFEDVKRRMDAIAAVSVSETTATFVINDASSAYGGEPFEQALLHVYAALNYLELGEREEARVEALQADVRLKQLAEDDDGPLASDPFARYLAGMVYESRGELSDALISYRKAYESYSAHQGIYGVQVPATLKEDLLRLTARVGIESEHKKFRELFGAKNWRDPGKKEDAEIIVLLHNGLAPIKREHQTTIIPVDGPLVRIALPYYERRPSNVNGLRVRIGEREASTEPAEDIESIAVATLNARMPAITARGIARALAKYKITEAAGKENKLAGFVSNMAGLLTERADTRSWLSLPGQVQILRLRVPAGTHNLRLELLADSGNAVDSRELTLTLAAGEMRFISRHWIPPYIARITR